MTMTRLLAVLLAFTVSACGGGSGSPAGNGQQPRPAGGPIILERSGTVSVTAAGGTVSLPAAGSDTLTATFPRLGSPQNIDVISFTGPAAAASPQVNAWSPQCVWPTEEIQMEFPSVSLLAQTPALQISSPRINGAQYFYLELFDADASPVKVIAQERLSVAPTWPQHSAVLPAINARWNVIADHHYYFEIVSSTDAALDCTGIYN